jgi:K+-transporting ATPase ATPase A chain
MTTEWIGVLVMYGLTVLLAIPLGKFLAKVFKDEPNAFDFMKPLERLIYRLGGVDPTSDLTWKQNLVALLTINLVWFVMAFVLLLFQANPRSGFQYGHQFYGQLRFATLLR